jgi:hypothetical protein
MLILLMGGIYEVHHLHGLRWHGIAYILSFMTID